MGLKSTKMIEGNWPATLLIILIFLILFLLSVLFTPEVSGQLSAQERFKILEDKGELMIEKIIEENGDIYLYHYHAALVPKIHTLEEGQGYIVILETPTPSSFLWEFMRVERNGEIFIEITSRKGEIDEVLKRGRDSFEIVLDSPNYQIRESLLKEIKEWYAKICRVLEIDTIEGFQKAYMYNKYIDYRTPPNP